MKPRHRYGMSCDTPSISMPGLVVHISNIFCLEKNSWSCPVTPALPSVQHMRVMGMTSDSVVQNLRPVPGWFLSSRIPQDITIDPVLQEHNPRPNIPDMSFSFSVPEKCPVRWMIAVSPTPFWKLSVPFISNKATSLICMFH